MDALLENKNLIGINGLGRIGKLTLWSHIALRHFEGAVVNLGRQVGTSLEDLIDIMQTDSTYGAMNRFLYGNTGTNRSFTIVDEQQGILEFDGFVIKILRTHRNPREIQWKQNGVAVVIDCTGIFTDPTLPADHPGGSLRGHLDGGARKVIVSAPFKIKDKTKKMPEDSFMMVYGINHLEFKPEKHHVLSAASCTTTGLSHMINPLLLTQQTSRILTASMSTVHAATNSQSVLDAVPKANASDLRKTRSVFNNIILSTTGAAKALESIIPQISQIGFMADSVRIPTNTVSLIILNITFSSNLDEKGDPTINQQFLNNIYKQAAEGPQKDLLVYSQRQNVSSDLMGFPAAIVIEGHETHTRTGFLNLPEKVLSSMGVKVEQDLNLPVTHAKIFGWYDNEYGSYVNCLGKLVVYVDKNLA
ncbi:MAG: glyceraldehyde 3-phosphate dehydrogenase NAD-binding domain-containing protein [Bacteroidales bacterium]